jgi:hypothetical protein
VNVSKIEVVFENCEEITVPVTDVIYMYAADITNSMCIHNILRDVSADTFEHKTAGYFELHIINKPEYGRVLAHADITQIHLYDQSGDHEWLCVNWHPDDEYSNRYQTTRLEEDEIFIRIGKPVEVSG